MDRQAKLAVIGGSGLYTMAGLTEIEEHTLDTPFGKPSAPIMTGELTGTRVSFLARHGWGHHINPTEVNYSANIYALKMLGAERIVSISACGSLREDYAPGDLVIPDQLFDLTRERKRSFFEAGLVAHVGVADPFCPDLSEKLYLACKATGATVHHSGAFITIEGPRFSTKVESSTYRAWGMSLVGMTTSPEAFLAREAECCYSVMAHVTDYDVWHVSEEAVTVEKIVEILHRNTQLAQEAVKRLVDMLEPERPCQCGQALENTLITRPEAMLPDTQQKLSLLVDKYLKK